MKPIVSHFLFVLTLLVLSSLGAEAQWTQTSSIGGGPIQCFLVNGNNLFVGTMNGGVFLTTNNGASWSALNNGLTNKWVTSLVYIGNNLFAGTNGGVFLSTNNGASWTGVNNGLGGGQNVWALAVSGSTLFAGTGIAGGVFRSTDYGTSWTALTSGPTNLFVAALAVSGTNLYAGTWSGIYVSSDNGTSWRSANAGLINTKIYAFAVSGATVFAGTDYGIFRTTNGGTLWTAADTGLVMPAPVTEFAVNGSSVFTGMHSTSGGSMGVFLSTDNGMTWIAHNAGLPAEGLGGFALAVCGGDLFNGGQSGVVWKRPMSELTNCWMAQTSLLGTSVLGQVQFVSSTEGWIVGGGGKLLHTTNFGSTWSIVAPGGTDTVGFNTDNIPGTPLSFINPSTGWIIGTLGGFNTPKGAVLYKTTNGGTTWSKQLLSSWSVGWNAQFVDANNGWATTMNGTQSNYTFYVIRTTDGGASWSILSVPSMLSFFRFIDPLNGWMVSDSVSSAWRHIQRTSDGGVTWKEQMIDKTPGWLQAIQFLDANNGWTVGDSGKIFSTVNGGTTWAQVTNTGNNSGHKALFFLNANVGWIGGRPFGTQGDGIVLHTTDGGKSWTIQDSQTYEIYSICFVDASNGWLSADKGLAKSISGATTFVREENTRSLPTSFALEQSYPNPFNPSTMIRFELQKETNVSLRIFNALGQLVATLVDESKRAGAYQVQWNASNVPSGTYFYRLQAAGFVETKKMVLLK